MMRRSLLQLVLAAALVIAMPAAGDAANEPPSLAKTIADAITELDVSKARELLQRTDTDSPAVIFERARLAIYRGDCETAAAILSRASHTSSPETESLAALAERCAGAVAGAKIVKKGDVWIRFQDDEDAALVPFVEDVAKRSLVAMSRDLRIDLPVPLRIDLVRDLFSLSAVTGLPVDAAETTGTVAVARWGRVTMISPRATPLGYPWEDTLAHEVTHLALTQASRDHAPLWLQEGVAKRSENRWREERPFDRASYDSVAKNALLTGKSVGVKGLGQSIALLPSAEAASIAFAEVTSFMSYWMRENGSAGLRLLLADMRGLGREDAETAMKSVSGYDLDQWIARWQEYLRQWQPEPDAADAEVADEETDWRSVVRGVRLGNLLHRQGHPAAAVRHLEAVLESGGKSAAIRHHAARALIDADRAGEAAVLVSNLDDIEALHGGWLSLHGRFLRKSGKAAEADRAYRLGVAVNPLDEAVACGGHWRPFGPQPGVPATGRLPSDPSRRALCVAARKIPRD